LSFGSRPISGDSPSSGLFRVKVYSACAGALAQASTAWPNPRRTGTGMPRALMARLPLHSGEEVGRLNDMSLPAISTERVFQSPERNEGAC